MKTRFAILIASGLLAASTSPVLACTAFCASNSRLVLVGNNEDYSNPSTKIWFVPAENGAFGRMYLGFDDFWPQGGMNEKGLWFDGFATSRVEATGSTEKPAFRGNIVDKAMAECATVEEVVQLFDRYNRRFLMFAVLMFADASGDSVIVEPDAFVRKKGRFQVQTNFHQSVVPAGTYPCERFRLATMALETAGENISLELFRRILAATHQEGSNPTLYSNICDLRRRVTYLYHFHNFENMVEIDLAEELKKGSRSIDLPSLFPKTFAAEAFQRSRMKETRNTERTVDVDPRMYLDYAGEYRLGNGMIVEILKEGDRLMIIAEGAGKVELLPKSATEFSSKVGEAQVTFSRGADGKVGELVVRQAEIELRGQKVGK